MEISPWTEILVYPEPAICVKRTENQGQGFWDLLRIVNNFS